MKRERETLKITCVLKKSVGLPTQQEVLLPNVQAIFPCNVMPMTTQLLCRWIRSWWALPVEGAKYHRAFGYHSCKWRFFLLNPFISQTQPRLQTYSDPPQRPLPSTVSSPVLEFLFMLNHPFPRIKQYWWYINWEMHLRQVFLIIPLYIIPGKEF